MPPIFSSCSRCVFRSFKRFERFMDRLTGRAGPIFVGLAIILIAGCAVTFFEVVFPRIFFSPNTSVPTKVLGTVWCTYIVYMFCYHYYKAVTIKPGSPPDPQRQPTVPTIRSFVDFLPQAMCVGPLRGLASTGKDDRWSARTVRDSSSDAQTSQGQHKQKKISSGNAKTGGSGHQKKGPAKAKDIAREDRVGARVCKKCPLGPKGSPPKPERTHHCSICKRCILKYDHHCPWINQCVGLYNERYFLLFLCYFTVGCFCVTLWAWAPAWESLSFSEKWPYKTPRTFTLFLWIITTVMAFAVGVMAFFQLWLIAIGETAVESHDNDYYRKAAKHRGRTFRNAYHLGWRENFAHFFNIGHGRYHWVTVLIPIEIPPASDGWIWPKAPEWEKFTISFDEELTDEEVEYTDDDDDDDDN